MSNAPSEVPNQPVPPAPTLAERAEALNALLQPVDPRDPTWRWVIERMSAPRAPLSWLVGIGGVCALGVLLLDLRGAALDFYPAMYVLRRVLVVGVVLALLALGAIGWLVYRLRAAAAQRHEAANDFFVHAQSAPQEARADLLDRALAEWREALEVCPRNLGPSAWATTQLCLARAAAQRAQYAASTAADGEDDPLLREAVTGYHVALQAHAPQPYAPEGTAQAWLATQRELAAALRLQAERTPATERTQRYEAAAAPLRAILAARLPEVGPRTWADTQIELAETLTTAARWAAPPAGYRLLMEAAGAYHTASAIYQRNAGERELAALRRAYADTLRQAAKLAEGTSRGPGGTADGPLRLLDEALAAYAQAQDILTRWVSQGDWAALQLASGQTWRERASLEPDEARRQEMLQRAVVALDGALGIYTPNEQPENWAASQQAQGEALRDLGQMRAMPERAQLLSEAVDALAAAQGAYAALGATDQAERANGELERTRAVLAEQAG